MAKCKIKVGAIRVLEETDELSSADEPYIIVFVADITQKIGPISVPNAKTTVFAFEDADAGELLTTVMDDQAPGGSEYCWGPDDKPAQINSPDQLIILAGMMENDDGNPEAARAIVNGLMAGSLGNIAGANLSRADTLKRLTKDLGGALSQARISGGPDFDQRIGRVAEVRLTQADLNLVAQHKLVSKSVKFVGTDLGDTADSTNSGIYKARFDLVPG